MCSTTFCEALSPSRPDSFVAAHEIWSRLNEVYIRTYQAQARSGHWSEAVTDELAAAAEAAFDEALGTVPLTIGSLILYVSMLVKHGVSESPESIDAALVTIRLSLEALVSEQPASQ